MLLAFPFVTMDVVTAAGVVGGLLQVVFDKYYGSKLEQWAARSGLHGAYINLKGELDMARAVLEALGRGRPVHNKSLLNLVKDLKATAYNAEDVLDDMDYFRLKEIVEGTVSANKLSSEPLSSTSALQMVLHQPGGTLASAFKNAKQALDDLFMHKEVQPARSFNRDAMACRIASITDRLKTTCSRVERVMNMQNVALIMDHRCPQGVKWRQTSSLITETKVFGRDAARDHIIQLLLEPHEEPKYRNFSVIPIVGIGGVGKTTLAQLVYKNEQVKAAFDIRAWACISEEFDIERVTLDILLTISDNASTSSSLNALHTTLEKELEGKKFLIVLDDVWASSRWSELCAPFACGKPGSRVIVTTRDQNVGRTLGSIPQFTLDGLESGDFWLFFKQYAFGDMIPSDDDKLVYIGRRIAKKLQGIPLAAKTIGRLLNKKMDMGHWLRILDSNLLEVENQQGCYGIMPALLLSYQHLSSNAQQCFAFCSVFPKDHHFSVQELISAWMAHGFTLEPRGDLTPELSARQHLNELLSVSFFQPLDDNHFTMHDLFRDLSLFVSEGECGEINLGTSMHVQARQRHLLVSGNTIDLVISSSQPGRRPSFGDFLEQNSLRTLVFTISSSTAFLLMGNGVMFSNIRMLSLPGTTMRDQLDALGCLIHLRYLDLQRSTLSMLPVSVCKLYQLQVLNIYQCKNLMQLPECFSDLIS